MSYFEDVVRWHRAVGHPVAVVPVFCQDQHTELGKKLVEEEFSELMDAYAACDLDQMADGAADLIWVVCGLCARLGVDLDAVWQEVRRANFEKVGGPVREDGKQLKPTGWEPPNQALIDSRSRVLSEVH